MATYNGSCHCGAVTYKVTADIDNVLECNCSICNRAGWRLTFVNADQFELLSGEDRVTDYQFAKKHLHHPFCNVCGVRAYSWGPSEDGSTMYAVNTRCLEGFDASAVEVNQYDGASLA